MDEATHQTTNQGPVQGQVPVNYGTVINNFGVPATPALPSPLPQRIWTVPYQRNPFFTGREDLLTQLHDQLNTSNATALTQSQAISGLGGIGKTQIALEYAYRYQHEYTSVLWLNAQSPENLLTEYITLADLLHLPQPEKDEHYQTRLIALVKQWFVQHERWLLILDNADNFKTIRTFIPTGGQGHLILTTREHTTGSIASLPIVKMSLEEGSAFLLRRAKLPPSSTADTQTAQKHRTQAEAIVQALDSLPLALDQAGAYLEETPSCSLSDYLEYYHHQRQKYLARRGRTSTEHASVTATFVLCFTQVAEQNALAADLLRCLAFLDAEDIPEEMLHTAASELGPHLQQITTDESLLGEAISVLLRYSLISYNQERRACSMHRLVQAVLQDEIPPEERHQWAEHVVRAINQAFPVSDVTTWQQCQRYLPHAQRCVTWIEQEHLRFPEAVILLNQLASYLQVFAHYAEALLLCQRALDIAEQALGPNHPDTAASLNNLATLYRTQGEYEQALPLYQRAVAICEQTFGPNHPDTSASLNNLALLYKSQGEYEQAEPFYQRALAIDEKVYGLNHPEVATDLNNLGLLYKSQGKYEQAEPLYQRALTIREQTLGPNHPDTAMSLNNLAALYYSQGEYEQALPLYQRAVAVREQTLGPNHPHTANSLNNLAALYESQGEYEQALPLYQRALAITEQTLGPNHPNTATCLNNLALLYQFQGEYEQALPLCHRALVITEKMLGPNHPTTKDVRANYTSLLESTKPQMK